MTALDYLPPDRARKKIGAQNQSTRSIEAQLETLLFARYYVINIDSFHFNAFLSNVFAMMFL